MNSINEEHRRKPQTSRYTQLLLLYHPYKINIGLFFYKKQFEKILAHEGKPCAKQK